MTAVGVSCPLSSLFRVRQVAQQLGLNPQTLYFYERIGLIPSPKRTASGYRLFTEQDIARLSFITRIKALGLSLKEIKEILLLQEGQGLTCEAMYCRLAAKVKHLDEQIQQLQALRDDLLPLVEQCQTNLNQSTSTDECVVVKDILHGAKNNAVG